MLMASLFADAVYVWARLAEDSGLMVLASTGAWVPMNWAVVIASMKTVAVLFLLFRFSNRLALKVLLVDAIIGSALAFWDVGEALFVDCECTPTVDGIWTRLAVKVVVLSLFAVNWGMNRSRSD